MSRKELLSIILMLAAAICLINGLVFANIYPIYFSPEQLSVQIICTSTAYICILYALSTWLYHSNYSQPRQEMRIVLIVMLCIMIIANTIACYSFTMSLRLKELQDSTITKELFSAFDVASRTVTLVLSIITIVLLFVSMLIVCVTATNKVQKRKQMTRRSKV